MPNKATGGATLSIRVGTEHKQVEGLAGIIGTIIANNQDTITKKKLTVMKTTSTMSL